MKALVNSGTTKPKALECGSPAAGGAPQHAPGSAPPEAPHRWQQAASTTKRQQGFRSPKRLRLISLLLAAAPLTVAAPPPLITVSISPEARVKAAAEATAGRSLQQGQWSEFTIVIENAAGITAPLIVESAQTMTSASDTARDRWLQLALQPAGPLTGQRQESRTLRLWSRDAGHRSAVLNFNAGQGTQDLGFRSDVTLTFKAAPASSPPAPDFTAVVAKGGGLWPQIQAAADGTLLAFGYNAAAHTTLPGDVDAWVSTDGGKTWSLRATAAARPNAKANMCHWASGFSTKGDLLIVASGMDDAANERGKRAPNDAGIFRSADNGKTWSKSGSFPKKAGGNLKPYPFGSIVKAPDGSLHTVVYTSDEKNANIEAAWRMTSRDDGRSWRETGKVADDINETVLLPLTAARHWLCIARTSNKPVPAYGQELRQLRSTDDGKTWQDEGLIADYHKHPPHLLRLKDGRILLTYGNRRVGSIETRLTADEGKTWSAPQSLYTTGPGDMGYPSTAQLPDGKLVTVIYASKSPLHDGYHMGAAGWTAPSPVK